MPLSFGFLLRLLLCWSAEAHPGLQSAPASSAPADSAPAQTEQVVPRPEAPPPPSAGPPPYPYPSPYPYPPAYGSPAYPYPPAYGSPAYPYPLAYGSPAYPPPTTGRALGRSGRFRWGVGIELLGLGLDEVFTSSRAATGLYLLTATQVDLGPHWALRVPLSIDSTVRHDDVAYLAFAISPGLVYRWRETGDQRWIPFLGGGLRLGAVGVRRDFVGLPVVGQGALFIGHHHFDGPDGGHASDPNVDTHGTIAPEVWAGVEYHPNRWIAWVLGLTYTVARASNTTLHVFREGISFRVTL